MLDILYDDRKFRIKLLNTTYHLRFVGFPIQLSEGNVVIETLLTNLPENDFDIEAMKELYHLRWDIETFNSLSNLMALKHRRLVGTKKVL